MPVARERAGRRRYGHDDFGVLAWVALDRRLIAYYALADGHKDGDPSPRGSLWRGWCEMPLL